MNFDELAGAVFALYSEARYDDAIRLIESEQEPRRGHEARCTFWAACLESMGGRPDQAVATLRTGLERGLWWSPVLLEWDSDLAAMRERPGYRALQDDCDRAMRTAPTGGRILIVRRPVRPNGALLVALHGASSSAAAFAPRWEAATGSGVTLAVPQSSYASTSDGDDFTWPEPGVEDELKATLDDVRASYDLDPDKVLLGGFSQGGRLAVDMALREEPLPVRGVITVAAGVRLGSEASVPDRRGRTRRFWFLTGENDISREPIEALHTAFGQRGFGARLEMVPGLGHRFPDDFDVRLPDALAFVLADDTTAS